VDLKVMDADAHRRYTGVSNEGILENLRLVASIGTPYFVRIPLIAEVNASEENIAATADFLRSLDRPPVEVDLLPYHDIGKGKHERMGTVYNPEALSLSAPSKEEQERCVKQLTEAGLTVRIGG
jgi:pyruvate formate lyase activating enzyme